jgi:cobalt-zinc-cadmium efflux system protein
LGKHHAHHHHGPIHGHDHDHPHAHREPGHAHGCDDDHGHSHGLGHAHHHGRSGRSLQRALLVTLVFMVVEWVAGVYSNSLALMSDAAHMLSDAGALLFSLFVIWMARKPATPRMSYGWHRAEILGALASGISIWFIAGFLIYESVLRFISPEDVQAPVVFVVALVGLAANLASLGMLWRDRHTQINVRAAYLHVISDSLGSVGAVIAGAVLWWTGWRPIDPLITVIFSVLMLVNSWGLVKEAILILMEHAPLNLDPSLIKKDLAAIAGVREVHDLHIWSVTSGKLALSVHLISDSTESPLPAANAMLVDKYAIQHTTIQIEHPDRFQSARCYDCGK